MRVEQTRYDPDGGWQPCPPGALNDASLVLVFGSTAILKEQKNLDCVHAAYPGAAITGCSTAGEIEGTRVYDESLTVTAIRFDKAETRPAFAEIEKFEDSCETGRRLGASLDRDGLRYVLVLSDGLNVNGSELVQGLTENLPANVTITGGLAGDGARFQETLVVWDGLARSRAVVVIGLYGESLKIGCGSLGGWDSFGPERMITRSKGNVLYELDGRSALDLYKTYLGDHAKGLPATGLLFPLSLRREDGSAVVRTILSVDEKTQSLVFAGDVPEGTLARLMKANFDRLIDGAVGAATSCTESVGPGVAKLALLISCVGRKMVLKQRIEEEVEGVADVVGAGATLTGFYSYGEISPFTPGAKCELHNQTMTITTFSEDEP